jgi:phosphomannomutase
MQKQLFRQYDIRGKIGTEISIDDFYLVTHAILAYFQQQGCKALAIGMDGRVHSPAIFQQVLAACRYAGIDVYFIGVCSTPVTVYAQYHLPVQGCLMITASHNPASYNGLKIYYQKVAVEGQKLQQVYTLFEQKTIVQAVVQGQLFDASYMIDHYIDSLVQEFYHLKGSKLSVFIDCGNGTAGPLLIRLLDRMDWKHMKLLFEKVDGTYPNHIADPTDINNMQELLACVEQHPVSFGIGLDGDCDRVAVVSQSRKLLAADQLLTLFAQAMQSERVVADIKSSSVLQQTNAEIILAKTGCANIKTVMAEHNALIGGELSGHFFFKDRHVGYDDGIYGMLRFFEILLQKNVTCDELVATLPVMYASKEMRIPCADHKKFAIVAALTAKLIDMRSFKIMTIDGVRFESNQGWGLLRASNTEAVLSVCCQAFSTHDLQEMKTFLKDLLQEYIDHSIVEQYII